MEINDEIMDEKIENYLSGKMDLAEREEFESIMKGDRALRERVQLEAKLNFMVSKIASGEIDDTSIKKMESLESTIKEIAAEYKFPEKKSRNTYISWAIAAAATVLIFFTVKIFYLDKKHHDEIYAAYYKPISSFFSIEKNYALSDSVLIKGFMNLYDNRNYQAFIDQFNQLSQDSNITRSDKSVLQFYTGVALMEQGQHPKAVEQFQQIKESEPFYIEAQWYMALSCVSEDDIKNAKELLKQLGGGESKYSIIAEKILEEL